MYIEINKYIMLIEIRESYLWVHMNVLICDGLVTRTTKSFIYGKSCIRNIFCKGSTTTNAVWIHHN